MPYAKIIQLFPQAQEKQPDESNARYKRRKDGLYQRHFHYKDKSGKSEETTVYGTTQAEADQNKRDFLADVAAGLRVDKARLTVDQLIDEFKVGYKPTVYDKTYINKCIDLEDISEVIGGKRVREIELSDIQTIINLRAGMAKSYIHKLWVTTKQIFNYAVDNHIILSSPCPRKMAMPLGDETPHRELEQWERDLVYDNWRGHWFGIVPMCMMFGSCRPGESIALDDKDIDLNKDIVSIDEAISFPDNNQPVLGDPKTDASIRNVEIFPPLHDALVIYMEGRKPGLLVEKRSRGGGLMSYSSFRRAWASFIRYLECKLNGFSRITAIRKKLPWKKITFKPYDLRHTFCTMCYDAGVDMKTTAEWMGHGDEEVTYKIYAHLSRIRKQASIVSMTAYLKEHFSSTGSKRGSEDGIESIEKAEEP